MIKVIIVAPDFLIINTKKLDDLLYISTSSQFKMPSLICFFKHLNLSSALFCSYCEVFTYSFNYQNHYCFGNWKNFLLHLLVGLHSPISWRCSCNCTNVDVYKFTQDSQITAAHSLPITMVRSFTYYTYIYLSFNRKK